jgi:site-specific recombinase XerD
MRKSAGELAEDWGTELAASGVKPRECYNQVLGVRNFLKWLSAVGGALASFDEELAWAYQGYCLEKPHYRNAAPRSHVSVESQMLKARSFGDWLVKTGYWPTNPLRAVDLVRGVKNPPLGIWKEDQVGRYLDVLADWEAEPDVRNQMWAYRVHVMAEVQYATGLRMSELGALTEADLDLERFEIRVRDGKGGKDRVCYLTIWAADLLREYLKIRPLVVKGGEKRNRYLFGPKGESLARAYNIRLNAVAKKLEMGRWHNHLWRHALGYHLLRAGCPIRSIQGILGHEKIASTQVYTKVDAEDVRGVLDAHHPRAL